MKWYLYEYAIKYTGTSKIDLPCHQTTELGAWANLPYFDSNFGILGSKDSPYIFHQKALVNLPAEMCSISKIYQTYTVSFGHLQNA